MKVLIVGKDSYIGEHIRNCLTSNGYEVYELNTLTDEWKTFDYSKYDSIVHVAAIVHGDAKNASEDLFKKVNTDLPFAIASKAKESGVNQFVFLSTMSVFGFDKALSESESIICKDASLNPTGLYGLSKYEAEKKLKSIEDDSFSVAIVRPPNVYGPGCKGNYISGFSKLANMMFVCPNAYTNIHQSMLYIDNLSELIKLIIVNNSNGVFHPQDDYAPNTVEMIELIRTANGRKTRESKFFGKLVKLFGKLSLVKKIYGGIKYADEMSDIFEKKYRIVDFEKGLEITIRNNL